MFRFSADQINGVRQNRLDNFKTFNDAFGRAGQIYN
jgi:hypothetical protein